MGLGCFVCTETTIKLDGMLCSFSFSASGLAALLFMSRITGICARVFERVQRILEKKNRQFQVSIREISGLRNKTMQNLQELSNGWFSFIILVLHRCLYHREPNTGAGDDKRPLYLILPAKAHPQTQCIASHQEKKFQQKEKGNF
ncbi:hypothetical protein CEXT_664881 [Caerostris extrusa]|uniref:Uncharacterized protein n=1 Tax=Caerostris extrusa TaxID=172846 RepID=A0AAV4XWA6_CAEEX|nr:hypothetical protein CEXT_664881 [Caerostris extrusa]